MLPNLVKIETVKKITTTAAAAAITTAAAEIVTVAVVLEVMTITTDTIAVTEQKWHHP